MRDDYVIKETHWNYKAYQYTILSINIKNNALH